MNILNALKEVTTKIKEYVDTTKANKEDIVTSFLDLEDKPNIIPIEKCDTVGDAIKLNYYNERISTLTIYVDKITEDYRDYCFYINNIYYLVPMSSQMIHPIIIVIKYDTTLIKQWQLGIEYTMPSPSDLFYMCKINDSQWTIRYGFTVLSIVKNEDGTFTSTATNTDLKIYVPSALLEDYKVATNWSRLADYFVALEGSEYE